MNANEASARQVVLVTGPARSGKSEWAEHLAVTSGKPVVYIATATLSPDDAEWQERIQQHQCRRPADWKTVEEPKDLLGAIAQHHAGTCLLVDSLGTWVANGLGENEETWMETQRSLLQFLSVSRTLEIILVAEETGWGVIPAYPIGRIFRDRLGGLTRRIGAIADAAYLVTGGHALNLRLLGTPLPESDD